ncbi:MAG: enoyl-CoA hydratase/isomerase family protein [Xanthobacteraceae bacterium]|nr:enoyl-CoA hydratase/isomerase family protein [Xanthobacteraceae bacterium]
MAYDEYDLLRIDRADGITRVAIDHPPINLLDRPLFREMRHVTRELAADQETRVVVFSSAVEGFFLAHVDVEMIKDFPTGGPPQIGFNSWHTMCETLRSMPQVSIGVLEGRVGGGGSEISLAFDMRFASLERARFNQPEVALGLVPLGGGTQRLARIAGRSRALEIILGCDDFDAATAERYGWINRAISDEELRPFVDRLAARIARAPAFAVRAAKEAVLRAEGPVAAGLLEDVAAEVSLRGIPETLELIDRFLTAGGQTPAGEARLGALLGELVDRAEA